MTTQIQRTRPTWRDPMAGAITCLAYYNEVAAGEACPCGCGIVQPQQGHRDPKPRN